MVISGETVTGTTTIMNICSKDGNKNWSMLIYWIVLNKKDGMFNSFNKELLSDP